MPKVGLAPNLALLTPSVWALTILALSKVGDGLLESREELC